MMTGVQPRALQRDACGGHCARHSAELLLPRDHWGTAPATAQNHWCTARQEESRPAWMPARPIRLPPVARKRSDDSGVPSCCQRLSRENYLNPALARFIGFLWAARAYAQTATAPTWGGGSNGSRAGIL